MYASVVSASSSAVEIEKWRVCMRVSFCVLCVPSVILRDHLNKGAELGLITVVKKIRKTCKSTLLQETRGFEIRGFAGELENRLQARRF